MTGQVLLNAASSWAPKPLIVAALCVAAGAAALLAHTAMLAVLRRMARAHPVLHGIVVRTSAISRYAMVIVALSIALPFAPLGRSQADAVSRVLLAAFIVFAGWLCIVGINLALDRYIGRFRLDSSDNLLARKAVTQVRLLKRVIDSVVVVVTIGFALMSFNSVREFGVSLFASAGIAGLAAGVAARPVLENLIAGVQLAITQPIRLEDVLIIEGEYGTVEEINSTYVVLKLWDWRRMIVPLSYFFDKPFQNWTRTSSSLIGSVKLYTDYTVTVDAVRKKAEQIVRNEKLWDGGAFALQVTDARDNVIELRVLVSAANSGDLFDLRTEVREKLIAYLQDEMPSALPMQRQINIPAIADAPSERQASARR